MPPVAPKYPVPAFASINSTDPDSSTFVWYIRCTSHRASSFDEWSSAAFSAAVIFSVSLQAIG
jgi:hypothetical protein